MYVQLKKIYIDRMLTDDYMLYIYYVLLLSSQTASRLGNKRGLYANPVLGHLKMKNEAT